MEYIYVYPQTFESDVKHCRWTDSSAVTNWKCVMCCIYWIPAFYWPSNNKNSNFTHFQLFDNGSLRTIARVISAVANNLYTSVPFKRIALGAWFIRVA